MKGFVVFIIVALLSLGLSLILFGCFHWSNFWPLFSLPSAFLAWYIPHLFYGFKTQAEIDLEDIALDAKAFNTLREFSYAVGGAFLLLTYGIPVLIWFNSSLPWDATYVFFASFTCFALAFMLWWKRL